MNKTITLNVDTEEIKEIAILSIEAPMKLAVMAGCTPVLLHSLARNGAKAVNTAAWDWLHSAEGAWNIIDGFGD